MSPISNFARTALACAVAALLGGCVIAGDVRPYPAMAPIQPIMPPQAEPTAGAIYAAGPTLQLYSDRRARDVGDLLTITLLENTTAQPSFSTRQPSAGMMLWVTGTALMRKPPSLAANTFGCAASAATVTGLRRNDSPPSKKPDR